MKYLFIFLIILCFIAPTVEKDKNISQVFRDSIYNYITCLDTTSRYLTENVPFFSKLANRSYEVVYDKVMKNKVLTKHLVGYGETLDDIISSYNSDIDNIENFRKVVYMENPDIVSKNYEIKSGDYIMVPSD